jgi:uncharacterized membrane protein SpoIIM required for sporulation
MKLDRFLEERSADWHELEELCDRGGPTGRRLSGPDLVRLGTLYRAAAGDLAVARQFAGATAGSRRLEGLVTRAHGVVYARVSRSDTVRSFFSRTLWRAIYQNRTYIAVAALMMAAGVIGGALFALHDPSAASGIIPGRLTPNTHGAYYGVSVAARGGLAVQIFVNNIEVSCLALFGGFTCGLFTTYALAYNGALLGVLGALEWRGGGFSNFVRLIVPHGLLELSCIAIAGGAGLAIAGALINPGRHTRAEALGHLRPVVAVSLLGFCIFLVVAGLTEGFITPWFLPTPLALAVGVVLAGSFWTAVRLRGRPSL